MEARDNLERGRDACRRRAWPDAYRWLSLADHAHPLEGDALELLATSAYLLGRDDAYVDALDRAHRGYIDADERRRAARCAFWLGLRLALRGESGGASGWFARAARLVESDGRPCAEQGYLLLPVAERQLTAGEHAAAHETAARAATIGERFRDPDLAACARHLQGRALMLQRNVASGLTLLDEVMVAVTSRELSPVMTGLIYCSVIDAYRRTYAFDRAREWTAALARWCDEQPGMSAFTNVCRVHRAEIMQLCGAWDDALDEARRVCAHCRDVAVRTAGAAFYQQAEVHRLRGDLALAEELYRSASDCGFDPQPGLALLRLAQGRTEAALAAIRRATGATGDPLERARLLPAYVEVTIVAGDVDEARAQSGELDRIAASVGTEVLVAIAAHARGEVELVQGNAAAALVSLRDASTVWQRIDAPYLAARTRSISGMACVALGDDDGAALELAAARSVFEKLRAAPDLARVDALARRDAAARPGGLTQRELQVLRLVASGKTNRAIATELALSEKTVDRHLSNILMKLDVPSRAAATAYACRHRLI